MPVWRQQEELHNEIIAAKLRGEETGHRMISVEHNHVYTLGKSGNEANMLIGAIQLQAAHAESGEGKPGRGYYVSRPWPTGRVPDH